MSYGAPNTQSGFTLGTSAQPVAGGATGFNFGTAAAGAGDANKAATPGLPQTAAQGQAKTFGQPFGTGFAKPASGVPVFGTTPMGAPGFGSPGIGATGFGLSQPKSTPPSTNAPLTSGLTFGTPIGTTQAVTSQPLQMGFQQSSGLGLALSTQSATPGSTFGTNPATTATSALALSLGGTPASSGAPTIGGINFGAPKTNVAGTPATSSGGLANLSFGTSGAAGNQPASSSTGFNITGTTQQTIPSSGAAPVPAQSTAGGFNLSGVQIQAVPATGTSFNLGSATTTPAQPATGFSLGTPASSASFALASASPATGFNLGTPASSATFALVSAPPATAAPAFNSGGTTVASSTPGFSLGKSVAPVAATVAQTSAPQTSLGTATSVTASTVATSQPAGLNFCQLEESINKWTLELEEQEKAFVNQATQVNAWDRLLIANGEKIVTLNQEVERVKLEQQQLEHELDYVVGQQRELQDCLVPLEKELASVSASDPEREYTYRLSENLDTQLKQMSEDLKEIIEHLNEANRSQDSSDPIVQIGKILNAHMNSLQWLDQRTAVLQTKIGQIDQLHQNFRQEHERSFNLAYN